MNSLNRCYFGQTLLLLGILVPLSIGCGSETEVVLAPVTGVVTNEGAPVSGAIVEFFPDAGRTSVASTNAEGVYVLKYGDSEGAVVGACRVQITPGSAAGASADDQGSDVMAPPMEAPPTIVAIQEKVTVNNGENKFDFEMSKYTN